MLRIPFVLLLNLYEVLLWSLSQSLYRFVRIFWKRKRYVKLELEGEYPFGKPRGLARYFHTRPTFLDLRRDIKTLADDPDVDGVVVVVGGAHLGAGRNAELVGMLDRVREAGKEVLAHGDSFQTRDYLQATAADRVLVAPAGRMYTFGPRFESYFLAGVFERHGIDAQFIHIGAFKAAAERFVRTDMSPGARGMLESIRSGLLDRWVGRVAERRGLTSDAARRLFTAAPSDPRGARVERLVDDEVFIDDVDRWLATPDAHTHAKPEEEEDAPKPPAVLDFDEWKSARPHDLGWRPLIRRGRKLALVDLSGMIVMPNMQLPGNSRVIDPDEVLPVLRRLAERRRVGGVLLHIDSPGGSALASDLMWKAIRDLAAEKPVVAYCSNVAASGGYYLAVGAHRIICHPETITGSIGVITGKFSGGDAARRLGVTFDAVGGGDGSEFMSLVEPLTPALVSNLRTDTRSFYRRFLQRVGQARDIPKRRLHRFARGRVYLGDEALERGLVDGLGGFEAALDSLRTLCAERGVRLGPEPELEFIAHRRQKLRDMLTQSAARAVALDELDGLGAQLAVLRLLRRDPVLALMPWRLDG